MFMVCFIIYTVVYSVLSSCCSGSDGIGWRLVLAEGVARRVVGRARSAH